jgi:hypothetical protein
MADTSAPKNHLGTDVPSGHLDEKKEYDATTKVPVEEEEEDEDMDALIEELESQDAAIEEEEEETQAGAARIVPEELLQTSTRDGLTSAEVLQRRKKFGLNQMKEEKENLVLKFLGFFVGPIQFVMEVSCNLNGAAQTVLVAHSSAAPSLPAWLPCRYTTRSAYETQSFGTILLTCFSTGCRRSCCWSSRLGRFRCHLCAASAQRLCWFHPGIPSRFHRRRIEEDSRS